MDEVWEAAFKKWTGTLKDEWSEDAIRLAKSLGLYRENYEPERYRRFLDEEVQALLTDHHKNKSNSVTQEQVDAATEYLTWESFDDKEWDKLQARELPTDKIKATDGETILGTLETYLERRNWTREKSKDTARRQIKRFTDMVGNLKLTELEKIHAYKYAQAMNDAGYAHKTIRSSVSAVASMLDHFEQWGFLKISPFVNLKLSNYGTASQSYLPLERQELHQLFKQDMDVQERLLLSILITTGMRLDEAALLTWERVKEIDGIRFFSLIQSGSEEVIVKNSQSRRLVALPDCLILPERATGRLFDYKLDKDGKAENAASRALMKAVRRVTTDKLKAVHSLRGNLKDLLRDAGIPKEINDFITGHSQGGDAGKYGSGPSLETKYKAVNSVAHPWLA
jgi:integrase